jgi:hypothetical protein
VERIYVEFFSYADHDAMEAVEWLYPAVRSHRLFRALADVYGGEETESVVKKALLDSVFRYCFMQRDLARRYAAGTKEVIVVPDLYRAWQRGLRGGPVAATGTLPHIHVPRAFARWSEACGAVGRLHQNERIAGSVLRAALRDRVAAWRGRPAPRALAYENVFALDQPFQTKFTGGRRFDFLVDEADVTRRNTAFLVRPAADGPWAGPASAEGFEIVPRSLYEARISDAPRAFRRALRRLVAGAIVDPTAPAWLRGAAATGASAAARGGALLARVACRNYIYTNQDDLDQRWLNALLRRHGARSWCFTLAIGGGYLYSDGPEALHRLYAYQNPDHLVTSSRQLVAYHKKHRQRVEGYHAVGNIWAEAIQRLVETGARETLRTEWFGAGAADRKIVAWFDTTFIEAPHSESTYTEAIAWYRDLQRLLDELDVLAVVKPSKDVAFFTDPAGQWSHPLGARIAALWDELRADPRVHFAGHQGDPASVIAGSDLTVTFSYSSVSAEALGARRRAIWYEPGQRWRGALYDRAPGLVTHGYDELVKRARELCYHTDDTRWDRYLETEVKGLVEDHLDGRAATRFRSLLAGAASRGSR